MNNIYTPLHIHDDISLLDSVAKPSKIIKKCKQNNFSACAVTNHGSVGSSVKFSKLCHDNNIKPILGIEFYVSSQSAKIKNEENRSLSHSLILAKNLAGWNQLIRLVSAANRPENFYYKPRLSLEEILEFANGSLIFFSGHLGSTIADNIFTDTNKASKCSTEEEARQYLNKECVRDVSKILDMVKDGFGKENVFLEVQLIDSKVNPCVNLLARGIRYIAEQTNTPLIATPDAHYVDREDAEDQRVLLCNSLNTTFNKITKEHGLYSFFKADNYFIPTYQEMVEFGNTEEELKNTLLIADMCENYKITRPPILPKFNCPNGLDSATYLKQLCEEGWRKKIEQRSDIDKTIYKDRLNYELNMLTNVGLSDYFLIVEDIIKYTKQNNILAGPGRGSAAGCLILYLLDVTKLDPIKYGLMISRFWNPGRSSPGKISLPDVDMDFEAGRREDIIKYITQKYGEDRVSHIITLGRLQGCGALKDVLRAYGACSFDEMNRMTKYIPNEAEISDELQAMKEEDKENGGDGEASIIRWALENQGQYLQQWAFIDTQGEISGPYAKYFKQAIRLEGTKKTQGQHASGIVVANESLSNLVPMVYNAKDGKQICGFDLNSAEDLGLLKIDVLSLSALDKIHKINDLMAGKL